MQQVYPEINPLTNTNTLSGEINESNLPSIISGQVNKLNDLDKSVQAAIKKAEAAKESASRAHSKSAGLLQKKVAIEALQEAGYDLAEAVISGTEAQKISFEFQTKLAEISKYLFGLGVGNIALNRMTVRQLQLKLEGASKEKISKLAQEEIMNVIRQLKAQEDILIKQNNLEKIIRQHNETIQFLSDNDAQHAGLLKAQIEKDEQHDELLKIQVVKDQQHDILLKMQIEKDEQHDELLKTRIEKDEQHDVLLYNLDVKTNATEEKVSGNFNLINENAKKIYINLNSIGLLENITKEHTDLLSAFNGALDKCDEQLMEHSQKILTLQMEIDEMSIENEESHSNISSHISNIMKSNEIMEEMLKENISTLSAKCKKDSMITRVLLGGIFTLYIISLILRFL